jgi:hypothetical protein
MHGVKLVGTRRLRFEDVILFDPSDFVLVDIVNDAARTTESRGFLADPGAFVYDLELSFDARRVQDERIQSVRVEVFGSVPTLAKPPKQTDRSRAVRAKTEHQEIVNDLNNRRIVPIFVQELQLDVVLPNDSVQSDGVKKERLHANLLSRTDVVLNVPINTQTREQPHPIIASVSAPRLDVNVPNNRTASAVRRDGLRKSALDPAKIGQSFVPLLPTTDGLRNVGTKEAAPHYDPYGREAADIKIATDMSMTSRLSLQSTRNTMLQRITEESLRNPISSLAQSFDRTGASGKVISTATQVVDLGNQIRVESYFLSKKFRLELDKSLIGLKRQLFIRLTPILSSSRKGAALLIEPATFQVQHVDQVRKLITPKVPPRMERVRNDGNVTSFRITQMDPIASKIIVLKRIITPDPFDEEPSTVFDEIDLGYGDDSLVLTDNNAGNWLPNQIVYTAMAQHDGQDGPFDSLVFDGRPCPFARTGDQDEGTTNLSIVASSSPEGINVRIGRIPENVTVLTLFREQLNANGPRRSRTIIVKDSNGLDNIPISSGTEGLEFLDTTTKLNGKYRYFCVLTLRGGQRVESNDDEIAVRRVTKDKLPLDVELYQPETRLEADGSFSVSMDLLTQQKSNTFQYVKDLLGEQSANQEFLDEIENNRDELTDIMIFYVQRVDLKTGKRDAMGFHKAGTFVDDALLAEKLQVSAVKPGRRYAYSFTACLVPPSTFLAGTFNRLSTGNRLGVKDIEYLANKFDNYVIRNFGVLPSNAQLIKKLDAEQLILIGNTGINFTVEADIPTPIDVLRNVTLDDSKVGTKVSWSLARSVNDLVDYCNVYVTVNGTMELIGSVRNSGVSGSMYLIDDRYHRSIGTRYYSIIAIFYDGISSIEIQSDSIERLCNTNSKLLKGLLTSGKILGIDPPKAPRINALVASKTSLQVSDLIKSIDASLALGVKPSLNLGQGKLNAVSISPLSIASSVPVTPALQTSKLLPNVAPAFNGKSKLAPKKLK